MNGSILLGFDMFSFTPQGVWRVLASWPVFVFVISILDLDNIENLL